MLHDAISACDPPSGCPARDCERGREPCARNGIKRRLARAALARTSPAAVEGLRRLGASWIGGGILAATSPTSTSHPTSESGARSPVGSRISRSGRAWRIGGRSSGRRKRSSSAEGRLCPGRIVGQQRRVTLRTTYRRKPLRGDLRPPAGPGRGRAYLRRAAAYQRRDEGRDSPSFRKYAREGQSLQIPRYCTTRTSFFVLPLRSPLLFSSLPLSSPRPLHHLPPLVRPLPILLHPSIPPSSCGSPVSLPLFAPRPLARLRTVLSVVRQIPSSCLTTHQSNSISSINQSNSLFTLASPATRDAHPPLS